MFKKMLALLSSFSVAILATASVVSCGPVTFEVMRNWTVDTETFYGPLKNPISSWSSGKSMNQADGMHIANLVDSLLQNDEYNEIIGDIADGWKAEENYKKWTLHINPKAEWFNSNGTRILDKDGNGLMIKAHDMANTMRYVFNPYSISETLDLWSIFQGYDELNEEIQTFIKNFDEKEKENPGDAVISQRTKAFTIDFIITKYIEGTLPNDPLNQFDDEPAANIFVGEPGIPDTKAGWKKEREDFQKANPDKIMLKIDDETGLITFNTVNPAEFFPSILTYVALAPMPDIAVNWLKDEAYNYGKKYDSILVSGAYYVSEFNPSSMLAFKANENYFDKENVHIKKVLLHDDKRTGPSANFEGFRSRDNSHVTLRADDVGNWTWLIGKDQENPNFEGVHLQEAPSLATWGLMYNYGRKTSPSQDPKDEPTNWALAQVSTRALISYALDRQLYNKYWTRISDPEGQKVSALTYNRYVPQKLINLAGMKDENFTGEGNGISGIKETVNDYTELVNDQYLIKIADPAAKALNQTLDGDAEIAKANLGGDLLLNNDYLAYNSLGYGYETADATTQAKIKELQTKFAQATDTDAKIQVLIEKVNFDYQQKGIPYSSSPSNRVTLDFLIPSLWSTNRLSPLDSMVRAFSAIKNNPVRIVTKVSSTMDDYNKIRRSKDYNIMLVGWSPDFTDPSTFLDTLALGGSYEAYQNGSTVVNYQADDERSTKIFGQLKEMFDAYDKGLAEASQEIEFERYNNYAKQEADVIYKYFIFNPIFNPEQNMRPTISFQNIFTMTTIEVGTSREKYARRKMIPKIWTKDEYLKAKEDYENNRQAAKDAIENTLNEK